MKSVGCGVCCACAGWLCTGSGWHDRIGSGAGFAPWGVGDPGNQRELGVHRRQPRMGVHRRWPEKPSTTRDPCCVDGIIDRIARNLTASRERECQHPQFIEHEKVCTYHRMISRKRRARKQSVQSSKHKEDAGIAEWGQACSIRHWSCSAHARN